MVAAIKNLPHLKPEGGAGRARNKTRNIVRVGQKFRRRLESDRQAVINEFEQEFPDWLPVFGTIDDLVVRTVGRAVLVLTAPDFTDGDRCSYLSALFFSFLKTHFICGERGIIHHRLRR